MTNSTKPPMIETKVVLLGKASCGKTSMLERYSRDRFNENNTSSTIGATFFLKKFTFNKFILGMGIWDTAGSERFEAMARMYYRDAKAAIVCYDVTCLSTYHRAVTWINELKESSEDCAIYMCGTKIDLVQGEKKNHREVDLHDVLEFADSVKAKVFETSSKTGEGIVELFTVIAKDLSQRNCVLNMVPGIKLHTSKSLASNYANKCAC